MLLLCIQVFLVHCSFAFITLKYAHSFPCYFSVGAVLLRNVLLNFYISMNFRLVSVIHCEFHVIIWFQYISTDRHFLYSLMFGLLPAHLRTVSARLLRGGMCYEYLLVFYSVVCLSIYFLVYFLSSCFIPCWKWGVKVSKFIIAFSVFFLIYQPLLRVL